MKNNIFSMIIISLFLLSSCKDTQNEINHSPTIQNNNGINYIDSAKSVQSVCLYDILVRNIDSSNYVSELYFVNFENSSTLPPVLTVDNKDYFDDGLGNDLIAADGIYTSSDIFLNDPTIGFISFDRTSIYDNIAVNSAFDKYTELNNFAPSIAGVADKGGSAELEAEICLCGCSTCNCLACQWFGGPGCWYFCGNKFKIKIVLKW